MSANDKKVAHYAGETQHWDVVLERNWCYLVGNATKYLWRLGKKHPSLIGQLEDLDKARHYLDKKREVLVAEINRTNNEIAAMGVLGVKKRPLTIGDIVDELEAEAAGPGRGYVNQG